ncbi:MAG: hypothetical protein M3511_11610 [Deinococcota bacterium]|nr:hypothetical protein [Deinococcota bacterium]
MSPRTGGYGTPALGAQVAQPAQVGAHDAVRITGEREWDGLEQHSHALMIAGSRRAWEGG